MRSLIIIVCMLIGASSHPAMGQLLKAVPLSETENAYNPIPNPDGSLIAYVRTGWGRPGGSGGFGSSNLVSEVKLMNADGKILSSRMLSDAFLYGWTSDGNNLICFRDWEYSIVSPDGKILKSGHLPELSDSYDVSERVAFLSASDSILWLQNDYTNIKRTATSSSTEYMKRDFVRSVVQSSHGEVTKFDGELNSDDDAGFNADEMLVLSPNEKYLALIRTNPRGRDNFLWTYDLQNKKWANLGKIIIHLDDGWDYIKPAWNPWFVDSSRLAFVSASGIVVSTPDGKSNQILIKAARAGLATPSPDGRYIAYATFEPRPMKQQPALKFWGGSTLWVTPVAPNSKARAVTLKDKDTTYSLHWLTNHQLVFDRIADELFYRKARLWKVDIDQ